MNVSANSAKQPTRLDLAQRFAAGSRVRSGGAGRTNVMALAVREFAAAACHYPIVFAAGSTLPIAVLGWREDQNSFVDESGRWRRDVYVPASARRSQLRSARGGDGAAHPWDASEAAESLDAQFEETRHFGVWLEANRMLEPRSIHAQLSDGSVYLLSGIMLVNPACVLGLTDAQVVELHRRGWLRLLHLHLQSLENWQRLGGPVRVEYQAAAPRP